MFRRRFYIWRGGTMGGRVLIFLVAGYHEVRVELVREVSPTLSPFVDK